MSFPPPTTASPAATPSGSSYYGYPTPFTYSSYQWPYTYGYVPTAPQTPARPPVTAAQQPTVQPRTSTIQPYTPAYVRETSTPTPSAATTHAPGRSARKSTNLKGLFSKELKSLMYGFGDDRNPANDTVNVLEEILIEYIIELCQTACGPTRKGRLSIEDLRKALSNPADAKKLARMEELLFLQEDIKRARAQFDDTDSRRF